MEEGKLNMQNSPINDNSLDVGEKRTHDVSELYIQHEKNTYKMRMEE